MDFEKCIKEAKVNGFIFECPKCGKEAVTSLYREQTLALAKAHYNNCEGAKP